MATAYAQVSAEGKLQNGQRILEVSREDTGQYTVVYDFEYSDFPGVTVSAMQPKIVVWLSGLGVSQQQVMVTDLDGNPQDGAFSLLAIGND